MMVQDLIGKNCSTEENQNKDRSDIKKELLSRIECILSEEKVRTKTDLSLQEIRGIAKPEQKTESSKPRCFEEINLPSKRSEVTDVEEIKKKICRLCTYREQSTMQLRRRFKHEGYSEEVVEQALLWALENSLIDDLRYAEVLVRSRLSQGFGIAGIEQDLASLGFSLQDISEWPDAFDYNQEEEHLRALEYLKRRPSRSKNQRQACYIKLLKRGYDSHVASRATNMYLKKV